jgi:hypothetical protein
VKEQSHKDEMSAALRADFQRLRERGVSVELAPSDPVATTAPRVGSPVPERADLTKKVSDTDFCQVALPDTAGSDAGSEAGGVPRGLLRRVLGR